MNKNLIVALSTNGTIRSFQIEHNLLATYLNDDIQFCGAIVDCNVVAISAKNQSGDIPINIFSTEHPELFDLTHGEILLVGSDLNGMECDVDVERVCKILTK